MCACIIQLDFQIWLHAHDIVVASMCPYLQFTYSHCCSEVYLGFVNVMCVTFTLSIGIIGDAMESLVIF